MRLDTFDPANPLDGADPVYAATGLPVREASRTPVLRSVPACTVTPPANAPLAESLGKLLDDAKATLLRYVVFSDEQATLCTLFAAFTYVVPAFEYAPILHVHSDEPGCGKTTLLDCLALLCHNPWSSGGVTAAALLQVIDLAKTEGDWQTTLLDEIDQRLGKNAKPEQQQAYRALLNNSYDRKKTFTQCKRVGNGIQTFHVFGPVAFAGIGDFIPETVETRSIPMLMTAKTSDDRAERFRERKAKPVFAPIAGRLAQWSERFLSQHDQDAEAPDFPEGLHPRQQDILEPLFLIADSAGDEWARRAREAAIAVLQPKATAIRQDVRMIRDIYSTFKLFDIDRLTLKIIAEELDNKVPAWFGKTGETFTSNDIHPVIKGFGIKSVVREFGAKKLDRGYLWTDFVPLWKKHCPDLDLTPPRPYSRAVIAQLHTARDNGARETASTRTGA